LLLEVEHFLKSTWSTNLQACSRCSGKTRGSEKCLTGSARGLGVESICLVMRRDQVLVLRSGGTTSPYHS